MHHLAGLRAEYLDVVTGFAKLVERFLEFTILEVFSDDECDAGHNSSVTIADGSSECARCPATWASTHEPQDYAARRWRRIHMIAPAAARPAAATLPTFFAITYSCSGNA